MSREEALAKAEDLLSYFEDADAGARAFAVDSMTEEEVKVQKARIRIGIRAAIYLLGKELEAGL